MQPDHHTNIKALILDMDGVLWRDSQPVGNLPAIFSTIQQRGWKVTLATNNATLSVEQYQKKLLTFGVSLAPEQIVNSSMAVVHYLSHRYPQGGNVYVIGEDGLLQTLSDGRFRHNDEMVLAVIVGMDRQITYDKLRRATMLIRSGVPFIGTNPDKTFPTPEGLVPGTGALIAALEAATSIQPIIVGKPSPEMYLVAMERMGSSPATTVVVGDRLETDIAGGQQLGCKTGLVLSGVTNIKAAQSWVPSPDWIEPDLTALLARL
jgi:4-nitrophenyl phosphatase